MSSHVYPTGEVLQYQLSFSTVTGTGSELYDIVVLATPLQASVGSGVGFQGFTPPLDTLPGNYHRTVATVVHGYLNTSYFGFPDPRLFPFASVLTTDTPDLFFNSAASVCPVNISAGFRRKQPQEAGVYKVFSPQPLDKTELKMLFRSASPTLRRVSAVLLPHFFLTLSVFCHPALVFLHFPFCKMQSSVLLSLVSITRVFF